MYNVFLFSCIFLWHRCSVGVVVITSALHAVGHGFETHTEYFFSHEENIDPSFCLVAPQCSLLHFSVVEERYRTFLGRLICCQLVQYFSYCDSDRRLQKKALDFDLHFGPSSSTQKSIWGCCVRYKFSRTPHCNSNLYRLPQQYQNENDVTVSYIITCHCNCHVDDRKEAALSFAA